MQEEKEQVNPYEYGYSKDQVVMLNGQGLMAMMDLLNEVVETQPRVFAPLTYAESTEEVRAENGDVLMVKTNWKEHTPQSFFLTAAQDNGGVPGMTALGLKATQMLHALTSIHEDNINRNVAKKYEDLKEEDALSKLS
tara:strand:+ start:221 stop:634 length:414 start_codon:yes stop_codon:yes gene_type:complete